MNDFTSRCWECGRVADGGICTRAHPRFRLYRAISNHYIIPKKKAK